MGRIVETPQIHVCIKLHTAKALPDSSIQLVFGNQGQNDIAQSCKCGYSVQ